MFGADLYITFVVGIVISLLYAEKAGVLPGGIIVPAYLALIFDQPFFIMAIFFISTLIYFIVVHVLSRITILYGRRKFAAMLLTGVVLKLTFDYFYPIIPFEIYELRGIGVIVPGLIANSFQKQGVVITVTSTMILSGITFGIMSLYYLFF
ncbi:poly-gamma-glutamate biosynthesis protein PgsC [Salisediminibacterium selenitireducens]|uniref:Capsule biosynthesis protein CapC n=1 Tax=Bacillus selenitireducens (strain ATCC 700615 / DSM 15326 / MLS10) TaxID=439292 RepID=D6Y0J3_BACIE|nr:poly-gamma-glutamate biosynthesis protein PgsC [Salisediminibacterium selenitireducens]ADI00561.1 capsule biosynthesis protein CapC [[Bacillus] selenitireducens MLS10]